MPHESASASSLRHVFVYGTLRRGGLNDITLLEPSPQFVGEAQVAGVLYHLGRYPGLTLGGDSWVMGEVYVITPALEVVLDDIEDLGENPTDEYAKRQVAVDVQGRVIECLVYEINPRYVTAAVRIQHGDWLKLED